MTYQLSTLENGLRVATETLPGMESVTVAVNVAVGARYEEENEGGLSHMLEHMAFKGTKRRTARDIAEEMDMVGGNMNAYTSLENTVYHMRVLKDDVPLAVDMLADILQNSTFNEEELEHEKQVILQEIAMHQDTPDDLIFDHFSETAYPGQPIGRSILGTPELVSGYKQDDVIRYIGKHYHTSNMVVTAAGNIEHEGFVKLVGEHFNLLSTSASVAPEKAEYISGNRRTRKALEQLHVVLGFDGVSFHDKDYYTYQVLATLLGGGMSSRLFQEVREKRGLAYTVQAFLSPYSDSGILGIYAATSEERAPEMLPVLCDEVVKLQDGINDLELQRSRNQLKSSILMARESSSAIAEWIGKHLLCYGRYKPASEVTARIDAVTKEDVIRVSHTLVDQNRITLATLGPQSELPDYDAIRERFLQ